MTRFVLSGDDHLVHGRVAVGGIQGVAGIALTVGWGLHDHHHVDGNEDVVGLDVHDAGVRVVVCDGHNGFSTARAAFDVALRREPVGAGLVRAADEAAIAAKRAAGQAASGTTLVIADVSGTALDWASVGDSYLLVFTDGRLTCRNHRRNDRFVGYTSSHRVPADEAMSQGTDELRPGDYVVVASDGFDYADLAAAERYLATAPEPVAAAVELVRLTESTMPGDNVATAVLRI